MDDFLNDDARARILNNLRTDENRRAIDARERVDRAVHLPNGYSPTALLDPGEQKAVRDQLLDERAASLNRTVLLGEISEHMIRFGTEKTLIWLMESKRYSRRDAIAFLRETEQFIQEQVKRDLKTDFSLQVRRLEDLIMRCRDTGDRANEAKAIMALNRLLGLNQKREDLGDESWGKIMREVAKHERRHIPQIDDATIPARFRNKASA